MTTLALDGFLADASDDGFVLLFDVGVVMQSGNQSIILSTDITPIGPVAELLRPHNREAH